MKSIFKILGTSVGLLLFSCTNDMEINDPTAEINSASTTSRPTSAVSYKLWNFDDLNEWQDATQVGTPNYYLDNGNLFIFTHANSWDRTKIKSIATYTTGTYSWRVYVPEMGVGDMASIGAFLYYDDTHELDFEIGYGSQTDRDFLNAAPDDVIAFMTSQANPFQSTPKKIKRGQWYTLSIEIKLNASKKYTVNWKIDGEIVSDIQLNYGTKSKFKIFCSVENLPFIGDHIPYSQNYALFDFVEYIGR